MGHKEIDHSQDAFRGVWRQ